MRTNSLEELRELQKKAQKTRNRLGFSQPHEVIFQSSEGRWSDYDIIVEADGLGGAKLLVVTGNYPIDYSIKSERVFTSEEKACSVAESMADST